MTNIENKTQIFVEKARAKHGNKYDYEHVDYIDNNTKVKITCREHGVFEQIPSSHLSGCGCRKCSSASAAKKNSLGKEDFVRKARAKHGDKYSYKKVNYVNSQTKVVITCREHGDFEQNPNSHLRGCGCFHCGKITISKKKASNTDDFVIKANAVHVNRYNYSKAIYTRAIDKVIIICSEHGEFEQVPNSHLNGNGCPECGNELIGIKNREALTYTTEEYIERAKSWHRDRYDYSKTQYIGAQCKVSIICREHGKFMVDASKHLSGQGCQECSKANLVIANTLSLQTVQKRIRKMHGNLYTYDFTGYEDLRSLITITCAKHGKFKQNCANHIKKGYGCQKCSVDKQTMTTKEFIAAAKEKHGNLFDYSKVVYKTSRDYVNIGCSLHGFFEQAAGSHLGGSGCAECGFEQAAKFRAIGADGFIRRANKMHSNKYDYSHVVELRTVHDAVRIICPKHGEFKQNANAHMNGSGCSRCATTGFDPSKPAWLYVIKTDEFVGYGITNFIKNRIRRHKFNLAQQNYSIARIKVFYFESGSEARKLESIIKRPKNRHRHTRTTVEGFITEALNLIAYKGVLKFIRRYISEIL